MLPYRSVLLLLLLVACAPQASQTPQLTATATQTFTPTSTIDWFPATTTFTPAPTEAASPTPNMHPGAGTLLLDEDFSSDDFWNVSQAGNSTAMIANGRITLRTELARGFVMSVRNEVGYGDFYAEITAAPSLCEGEDEYGLVVRDDSSGNHYRFALSCDGRVKLDRFQGGSLIAQELWTPSLVVPGVAPSQSRLAVWADGSQLRFFVDDNLVLTSSDPIIFSGRIGVFIRHRNEGTLSVSFSNLEVWALDGEGL